MSDLINLIKNQRLNEKELISSTIRMPKDLNNFIDELAEYLTLSKQEVMLKLIQESSDKVKREFKLDEIEETTSNFYLLNTNKGNSDQDHDEMLKNGVAAAFYDPWKYNINRIQKGDIVFLYESQKGIIAYGKGTGDTHVRTHEGNADECHYQFLEEFTPLKKIISAKEIKKSLSRKIIFYKTMIALPDGQKLLDFLKTTE